MKLTNRFNKRIKEFWAKLKELCGNRCVINNHFCSGELQFAHLRNTSLNGRGRGRKERYYDIIKHLDCYTLLCESHHAEYDNGILDEFGALPSLKDLMNK